MCMNIWDVQILLYSEIQAFLLTKNVNILVSSIMIDHHFLKILA